MFEEVCFVIIFRVLVLTVWIYFFKCPYGLSASMLKERILTLRNTNFRKFIITAIFVKISAQKRTRGYTYFGNSDNYP